MFGTFLMPDRRNLTNHEAPDSNPRWVPWLALFLDVSQTSLGEGQHEGTVPRYLLAVFRDITPSELTEARRTFNSSAIPSAKNWSSTGLRFSKGRMTSIWRAGSASTSTTGAVKRVKNHPATSQFLEEPNTRAQQSASRR